MPQVPWVRKGLGHLLTHTSVCVGWPEGRAGVLQSSRCGELALHQLWWLCGEAHKHGRGWQPFLRVRAPPPPVNSSYEGFLDGKECPLSKRNYTDTWLKKKVRKTLFKITAIGERHWTQLQMQTETMGIYSQWAGWGRGWKIMKKNLVGYPRWREVELD